MMWMMLASLAMAAPQVQPVGLIPAAQDQVEDGETWMGLFSTGTGWEVRETVLAVAPMPEGTARWEGLHDVWATCAVAAGCSQDAQPLVVMRNVPGIRPGAVPSTEAELALCEGSLCHTDAAGALHRLAVGTPAVLWSGDLDGDGLLDFVLSQSDKGELQTSLVLSGGARGLAVAAQHTSTKG